MLPHWDASAVELQCLTPSQRELDSFIAHSEKHEASESFKPRMRWLIFEHIEVLLAMCLIENLLLMAQWYTNRQRNKNLFSLYKPLYTVAITTWKRFVCLFVSFCRCEVENIVISASVMRIRTGLGKGRDRQRQTQERQHFWTDCPQTDATFSHQHGISRLPHQMAFILSVLIVKRLVHIGLNLWRPGFLDYRWSETVRRLSGATYTLRAQETFTFISEVWERMKQRK